GSGLPAARRESRPALISRSRAPRARGRSFCVVWLLDDEERIAFLVCDTSGAGIGAHELPSDNRGDIATAFRLMLRIDVALDRGHIDPCTPGPLGQRQAGTGSDLLRIAVQLAFQRWRSCVS